MEPLSHHTTKTHPFPRDVYIAENGSTYHVDRHSWNDPHRVANGETVEPDGPDFYWDEHNRLRIRPPGYTGATGAIVHNLHGPAIITQDGIEEHWVHGVFFEDGPPFFELREAPSPADGHILTNVITKHEYQIPPGSLAVLAEEHHRLQLLATIGWAEYKYQGNHTKADWVHRLSRVLESAGDDYVEVREGTGDWERVVSPAAFYEWANRNNELRIVKPHGD